MKKYLKFAILNLLLLSTFAKADAGVIFNVSNQHKEQLVPEKVEEVCYKKVGEVELTMKVYYPKGFVKSKLYPVIVLFHGGGWKNGSINQLKAQALELMEKGMIAITPEYRLKEKHGTTPYESVKDACSAIRFIRDNASAWSIDPDKIAVCGASAGGHLAAATDFIKLNDDNDQSKSSAKPNLLALFNPVINNGPGNYGYELFGDNYKVISPFHNIVQGGAPTIIFSGTKDNLVPPAVLIAYEKVMKQKGNECKLLLYDGQGHGFFNYKASGNRYYSETLEELVNFLKQHKFI